MNNECEAISVVFSRTRAVNVRDVSEYAREKQ